MTHSELWSAFLAEHPAVGAAAYQAWQYGSDDPDALLALTLSGVKTATASAYPAYLAEGEPLPAEGDYSVLLDSHGQARGIIQTTRVTVLPFSRVPAAQAWREGEGDRTLAFWQAVHRTVFTAELAALGQTFTEEMPVVCEEFTLVYPNPQTLPKVALD